MRTLLIGGALGVLVVSLAACGSSSASSSEQTLQHQADLWAIEQIEKTWHKAGSTDDVDLAMSLWAPNATLTRSNGDTVVGKRQIRRFTRKNIVYQPETDWVSETPAYKIRVTANGDRGTLYFECHYVDRKTNKLVRITGADLEVARINGRWLITDMVGASPTLSP